MTEYVVKRGKEVEKEEEDPPLKEEVAEEMKSILEEKMEEAWRQPKGRVMKRKLSKVAKEHWRDQIMEALKTTKYAEELKARAREIDYSGKIKKIWK